MTSRLRHWRGNLLLLAGSVTVACGLGEAYLRLFRPQPLQAAYVWADGTLRHRPSFRYRYTRQEFSNLVRFNSLGLRGREVPSRKTPGRPRILFLGDSFVEGKQVGDDQVLTAVLEGLAGEAGMPVEVINAGVAGYGTAEEILLWDEVGRSQEPDLVLLGFYPNDVRNNSDRDLFDLEVGRAVQVADPKVPKVRWIYDLRKFLASRSHLYMLFVQGERTLRNQDRAQRLETESAALEAGRPLEAEDIFARFPSPRIARGWSLTLALLDELRRRVESSGARFMVVVFPTRFQVDDALWEAHARRREIVPSRIDRRIPQRQLRQWADRSGVALLDLLEPFRERNRSNTFYHRVDAHWNPAGHRLAAMLIVDELLDRRRGWFFDMQAGRHIMPAVPRENRPAPEVSIQ
jgi:hypothetical protein